MAIETRTPAHSAISTAQSGPGPQHPRATQNDSDLIEDVQERGRRLAAAGERYAQSSWETGREALEDGSRHARQWARRHPAQLWTAVGAIGLFALWMAYRPSRDESRYDRTRH